LFSFENKIIIHKEQVQICGIKLTVFLLASDGVHCALMFLKIIFACD